MKINARANWLARGDAENAEVERMGEMIMTNSLW
jgi:hypothetical protein